VLARKKGQSIVINDDIELVVVDVQKDVVRLGIKAPKNVTVFRKEIYEEIAKENKMASEVRKIDFSKIMRDKIE
jgi:carbon storage regulator